MEEVLSLIKIQFYLFKNTLVLRVLTTGSYYTDFSQQANKQLTNQKHMLFTSHDAENYLVKPYRRDQDRPGR